MRPSQILRVSALPILRVSPQAVAYRVDQQWKELNFGPLSIFFSLLLFNGELRQLAVAVLPSSVLEALAGKPSVTLSELGL